MASRRGAKLKVLAPPNGHKAITARSLLARFSRTSKGKINSRTRGRESLNAEG
jgi:hypothetical protein